MKPHGLRNTSSPKFVVPQVRLHEPGSASSTVSLAASGSWTEPPVESWTTRSVASRSAWTAAERYPPSSVGRCSASRMCRWMSDAPAASQATAVATSSSRVVGSCGTSCLASSAPVGATVMRVPDDVVMRTSWHLPYAGHDRRSCGRSGLDDDSLRGGDAFNDKIHIGRSVSLDQRQSDRAVLVVPGDRGEVPDRTRRLTGHEHRRSDLGQGVPRAVEVQEDESPRRTTEVVDAGDRLLAAVAALVQMHGGPQPVQLVRDGPVVGL